MTRLSQSEETIAMKNKSAYSLRQGDVLLIATDKKKITALEKYHEVPRDRGRVVLAYGEVTGHAHAFHDPGVCLLAREGISDRVLTVDVESLLQHEEHGTIPVPPGLYIVRQQREWSWEEAFNVSD